MYIKYVYIYIFIDLYKPWIGVLIYTTLINNIGLLQYNPLDIFAIN